MKTSMKTLIATTATIGLMQVTSVSAAVLVSYDFGGSVLTPTTVAGAVTAGSVVANGSLARSGSGENMFVRSSQTGADLSAAVSDNDYISFTVTPAWKMNLTSLVLDVGFTKNTGTNGDLTVDLLSSIDGFAASVDSNTINSTGSPSGGILTVQSWVIDLSGPQFQGVGATEFRLYTHDDVSEVDLIHRLDNIVLNGEVLSAPEPSSLALLVVGLAMLKTIRKKRLNAAA